MLLYIWWMQWLHGPWKCIAWISVCEDGCFQLWSLAVGNSQWEKKTMMCSLVQKRQFNISLEWGLSSKGSPLGECLSLNVKKTVARKCSLSSRDNRSMLLLNRFGWIIFIIKSLSELNSNKILTIRSLCQQQKWTHILVKLLDESIVILICQI